jgi:hypothetical protein
MKAVLLELRPIDKVLRVNFIRHDDSLISVRAGPPLGFTCHAEIYIQ